MCTLLKVLSNVPSSVVYHLNSTKFNMIHRKTLCYLTLFFVYSVPFEVSNVYTPLIYF